MNPRPGFALFRFFTALLVFLFLGGFPAGPNPTATGKITPEKIVVDWNGDGLYDLLLGDRDGFINLFLNAGSSLSPDYASPGRVQADYEDLDVRRKASPCIVDWNGDGRLDLLVGNWSGELFLFLNEGSQGQPVFGKPIKLNDGKLDVGSDSSPDMVDLNGDGKKDLIVGNEKGEIFIFLNMGKDQNPQFSNAGEKIPLRFNDSASPRVLPWFRLPLKDLIVVDRYGEVTLCPNRGQAGAPAYTEKRILKTGKH